MNNKAVLSQGERAMCEQNRKWCHSRVQWRCRT